MKIFFFCLLTFPLLACAENSTTDHARVLTFDLNLESSAQDCQLRYEGPVKGALTLDIQPPCHFTRYADNVVHHAYNDVGIDAVVIVIGTPLSEQDRRDKGLVGDGYCGFEARGILLKGNTLSISSYTPQNGIFCIPAPDEKVYWMMAHP